MIHIQVGRGERASCPSWDSGQLPMNLVFQDGWDYIGCTRTRRGKGMVTEERPGEGMAELRQGRFRGTYKPPVTRVNGAGERLWMHIPLAHGR